MRVKIIDYKKNRCEAMISVTADNIFNDFCNTSYSIIFLRRFVTFKIDNLSSILSENICRHICFYRLIVCPGFRFDSSVSPLIFADQFIQFSTRLSSPLLYDFGEHQQIISNQCNRWMENINILYSRLSTNGKHQSLWFIIFLFFLKSYIIKYFFRCSSFSY